MTNPKDENKKKKPTVEEIDEADMDKAVGGGDRRLTTEEEEKRLKKEQAPGDEGTDIGSGGLTSG